MYCCVRSSNRQIMYSHPLLRRMCGYGTTFRGGVNKFKGQHTRGDMSRGHVPVTNSMHCLHEGTCSGDKFLKVFTRRNLSQGLAKWTFLIGLFWYCRWDMLHEQFTRGDNHIFCCFVAVTCPLNSNWVFSWKLIVHTRGHVAGTCPLVCADLKGSNVCMCFQVLTHKSFAQMVTN